MCNQDIFIFGILEVLQREESKIFLNLCVFSDFDIFAIFYNMALRDNFLEYTT
jgi:hypothetical protein